MKKAMISILALALLLTCCLMLPMEADAATEGYYTYTVADGAATITDCDQSISGDITIPATLDGYPVTAIGEGAFWWCTNLTSVIIPDSVTTIGEGAFWCCKSLTTVTVGESVSTIGEDAFQSCDDLTSVYITDVAAWCEIDFVSSRSNPLYFAGELYLDGVLVTDLVIPEGVTTIGRLAFENCDSLVSLTISDGVTAIGICAFDDCNELATVKIGNDVTEIGDSAFGWCNRLASVTIGEKVAIIGNGAFNSCNLSEITLPDSVTEISSWAFSYSELEVITIGSGLAYIGENAFYECDKLCGIYVDANNPEFSSDAFGVLFDKNKTEFLVVPENISGSYTIPDTITTIGDGTFSGCTKLTEITIPDSVSTIGAGAFYKCTSLTTVNIGSGVQDIQYDLDALVFEVFAECDNLVSIYVDENNPVYSSDAQGVLFNKEKTLLMQVPQKLSGCYKIPSTVEQIDSVAFGDCADLTAVTIPETVTQIAYATFYGCSNLKELVIPDSVSSIGMGAFAECENMTDVYYTGSETQWAEVEIHEYGNDDLMEATIHYDYIPEISGDLDGNEAIDEDDALYLLQYVLMPDMFSIEQEVDYDGSGVIDEDDAIYLLMHVLMPNLFPI